MCGECSSPAGPQREPRSVLVVKLSSLGDLVHALPAVHAVKEGWGARVDWVTQAEYTEFVRGFADVGRVIGFPRRDFWRRGVRFFRELRRTRYDLVLDLQGLLKSALVARAARAERRVGPAYSREGARWFYSEVSGPMPSPRRHAVDEALDVARHLGLRADSWQFPMLFPPKTLEGDRPRVGLVPRARWVTKNWPPENFVAVGRVLREQAGATLFVLGAAEDQGVAAAIAEGLKPSVTNLCGRTSLVELAGVLQGLDLVVAVDSGPMHVAAALGRPVVAVFCATDPGRTGPVGAGHRVLTPEGLNCWPCHNRRCWRGDLACLRGVSAEAVARAALEVLGAHK